MPALKHSCLLLIASTLLSGTAAAGEHPQKIVEEPMDLGKHRWNLPIAFALEARSVERDAAFGLHLVTPVFSGRRDRVLLEGYGYEGEGSLGMAGGGVIYRRELSDRYSLEVNGFFEGLRSSDGFGYPQLGAGLAITRDWLTIRANGYLPLRGKDSRRERTERWSEVNDGREVQWSRNIARERAPMRGFDVEAEFRLPNPPRWVDPRVAVGYAYREAEDRPEVHAGLTARTEFHFARHWSLEGEWRDDASGSDQEWRVGIRFQMLLGGDDAAEPADARAGERFGPAKRFPWPTVARGEARSERRRGSSRAIAVPDEPSPDPVDCCSSGESPLIFD